jgi:hypothetical protein
MKNEGYGVRKYTRLIFALIQFGVVILVLGAVLSVFQSLISLRYVYDPAVSQYNADHQLLVENGTVAGASTSR